MSANISYADLATVSLLDLLENKKSAQITLLDAATQNGFFYLDIQSCRDSPDHDLPLASKTSAVFDFSRELFDLPTDVKMHFDVDRVSPLKLNGYKPLGRNKVKDSNVRDGFESYAIGRTSLLGLSNEESFPVPLPLAQNQETLKRFMTSCHEVANVIFAALSTSLKLDQENSIEQFHQPTQPSSDILRLLKYRAIGAEETYRVPQTPHTDLGTLTLLFTDCLGLQVLAPSGDPEDWRFVEPKTGHIVVNIGDALTLLTGGVLKSSLHRVGPSPGQGMPERYSVAYLVRPADDTVLKPLGPELGRRDSGTEVEPIKFREWMVRKFKVIRGDASDTKDDWVLTSCSK